MNNGKSYEVFSLNFMNKMLFIIETKVSNDEKIKFKIEFLIDNKLKNHKIKMKTAVKLFLKKFLIIIIFEKYLIILKYSFLIVFHIVY